MLGIALITYNRRDNVSRCLTALAKHTRGQHIIVVADDGSRDDTKEVCLAAGVVCVTGNNRGVCWNKNRGLYYLMAYTNCEQLLLLEDDCFPVEDNWDEGWVEACKYHAHVNYGPHLTWPANWRRSGDGTPKNPYLSAEITGQATISTRDSIERVGYLCPEFVGYGFGHIEWTERFSRAGYFDIKAVPCMQNGLSMEDEHSFRDMNQIRDNYQRIRQLRTIKPGYCPPYRNKHEHLQLIREVERGLEAHYRRQACQT